MNSGGRASAVEKGKQKMEEDLTGAGVLRSLGLSPTAEIEEAPPFPPPRHRAHHLHAVNARGFGEGRVGLAAEAAAGPTSVETRVCELQRKEATLAHLRSQLQQLRRERGEGSSGEGGNRMDGGGRIGAAKKGKQKAEEGLTGAGVLRHLGLSPTTEIEEAPPSPPFQRKRETLARLRSQRQLLFRERELWQRRPEEEEAAAGYDGGRDAGAALDGFEQQLEMLKDMVKKLQDKMALMNREEEEETQLMKEGVKAWEEYMMTQPEHERKNNKIHNTCNKRQIALVMALASGLMLLIQFRTLLPPHYLSHIVGALAVLWIFISISFFRGLFWASKIMMDFRCNVAWLIYMCFSLFVLYAL